MIAGVVAALALGGVGCSSDDGGSPAASSVPPQGFTACEEIYVQGAVVNDDTFGLACVKNDVIVSPRPVRLDCSDGKQLLFNDLACNTCHRSDGSGRGPSLVNKFGGPQELANGTSVAVNEAYVRESILTPQAKLVAGYQPLMPTFQGLVSEESVMALVEYVKSLRNTGGGEARTAAEPSAAAPATPQSK